MLTDLHRETASDTPPAPRPRRAPRPWLQLLNAILGMAGRRAELLRHAERPWASVTFIGSRHTVALCFRGIEGVAAAETFIEALPEHEFTVAARLVADATIKAVEHVSGPEPQVTVEAEFLLLDD